MIGGPGGGRRMGGFGGTMRWGAPPTETSSLHVGKTLRQFLGRLRPEGLRIAIVAVLASASVAFNVVGPRILGNATDVIFNGLAGKLLPAGLSKAQAIAQLRAQSQGQLAQLLSGMQVTPGVGIDFARLDRTLGEAALVYVLAAFLNWLQAYLMAGVAQRTVYRMRRDVEAKLAHLPLRYFDSHPHGDLLSRVTNDIDNITTTLQQGLSQLLGSLLTVVGVLGIIFWINPLLAAISVVTIPLSALVSVLVARRSQRHFVDQWQWTGTLNGHVEEMYTGQLLVQVFGQGARAMEEFRRQNQQLYDASFRAQFLSAIMQPAMQLLTNLNYVTIAVVGGYRIVAGAMTLGDVQAFLQYARQFTMPITQIATQMNLLQSGLASAERVFDFLAEREEAPERATAALARHGHGRVTMEHVAFSYEPDKPLIHDLSLDVRPGQTAALVGPTGAGKTTIVNLLMRFYEIDDGRICLDGIDTRDLSRDAVRRQFGMVLQDTWLFAGTIRDNIAYGKEGATAEQIEAAATAAHADPFIRTLPHGYDTLLDEDAANISAGQRQLLTIARAFLAEPHILILDEATSNVDTRTEVLIQQAMASLRLGRTSFVIAHRLSTIRHADVIVVIDAGRIVEQGRHEELLRRQGFYAALYRSQFADDETEQQRVLGVRGEDGTVSPPSGAVTVE